MSLPLMKWFRVLLVAVALYLAALFPVYAQSQLGTGALSGTVQDTRGAVIAGATVTVTNEDTGLTRTSTTKEAGQFTVPVLPVGTYTVRVTQAGFAATEQKGLVVNVGGTATLRIELKPGAIDEVVNVTAEAQIDTSKTEEVSLINRVQINDLPINGRRADQFALLAPGVTRDGRFGLLSYRGQSGVFNNFTVEGNDDNQAYFAEARGRTRIASNISANAIQEFQVATSNFLPEFGRSAGGGINSVIRSGGNKFHGDSFWYFRNEYLNARDPLASFRPTERRDQFGGSFSGPVVKEKLFFFLNYDQQLRDFPLVTEDLSGVLTAGRPTLPANPTPAQQAQFNDDLAAFNAGVADLRARFPNGQPGNAIPRNSDQNLGLAKLDWHVNGSNVASFTSNHLNARGKNAIQTPLVLGNVGRNGTDDVRIQSLNARLTSTLSANVVNELRFQSGRNWEFQVANEPPPQVFVGGFSFGRATFLERPALPDERRLQFVNNLSWTAARHATKFGGEVNRAKDIIDNPALFGGSYSYSNALTYGRDLLNRTAPNPALRPLRNYTNFQQNFGLPGLTFSTIDYALFAQDQWKMRHNLTINYGLRYDYQQLPEAIAPNPAIPETQRIPTDRTNYGPRIGVAWDIRGNGKTVVRGGWGLYYGRTPNGSIFNALTQTGLPDPARNVIALTLQPAQPDAPIYPNVLPALPASAAGATTVYRLDPEFKRPRLQEVNLGLEREIVRNLTVSASFLFTKGDRLPVNFDTNLPAPQFTRRYQLPNGQTIEVPFSAGITRTAAGVNQNLNLARPNPNFGAINVVRTIGETWYRALFVEVKRRFAQGFQFNLAYTLAQAENLSGAADGGGSGSETPFNGSNVADQFKLDFNRAPAPTDQRHRFVLNGIWNLPGSKLENRAARLLLGGFRLSGIFTAESGRPFAAIVSVPNIPFTLDGAQYNGFGGLRGQGGGGDRNLAPNIERNSDYGAANYRLDLRVARDIRVTEKFTLELIGESFNLFNRSNFNGFRTTRYEAQATTVTTPLATPIALVERADFGVENNNGSQPDGTNARRFQLALRFRF
jgi:hypothetical protein